MPRYASNGLTSCTPVALKCRTSRVATARPCVNAVAAISKSAPSCPSWAESTPQRRAIVRRQVLSAWRAGASDRAGGVGEAGGSADTLGSSGVRLMRPFVRRAGTRHLYAASARNVSSPGLLGAAFGRTGYRREGRLSGSAANSHFRPSGVAHSRPLTGGSPSSRPSSRNLSSRRSSRTWVCRLAHRR